MGCDAARSCTALGTHDEDGAPSAFIHIERGGGASDAARVTLGWWSESAAQRAVAVRVLAVTTSPSRQLDTILTAPAVAASPQNAADDDYRLIRLDAAATQRLLSAARRAQRLFVLSRTGDTIAQSSLVGMSATLLAIDDAQRRIGTTTALARPGTRNPASIGLAPALPVVSLKPLVGAKENSVADSALAARLRRSVGKRIGKDCDPQDPVQFDEVEPLSATQSLVGLSCSRGAYNVWSRWYVVSNRNVQTARPALFLDYPGAKVLEDDGLIVNGGYDATRGRFGAFSKARGLGDCGSFNEWGWDGTRFLLLERREFYECRGVVSDWWPVTWRARSTP